jgi:hypothetical protein
MTVLSGVLVMTGLLAAGVVYGTDMFFAVVGRTALARTSEASLTETVGRLHEVADARMPLFGAAALLSTLALVFTTSLGSRPSLFAGLAVVGLATQLAAYLRVAQPVNRIHSSPAGHHSSSRACLADPLGQRDHPASGGHGGGGLGAGPLRVVDSLTGLVMTDGTDNASVP